MFTAPCCSPLTFLRSLIGGLILLPFALKDLQRWACRLTAGDRVYLLALGVVNICFSMTLFQMGHALCRYRRHRLWLRVLYEGHRTVQPFHRLHRLLYQAHWAIALSALILSQPITWNVIAGTLLILIGCLYNLRQSAKPD